MPTEVEIAWLAGLIEGEGSIVRALPDKGNPKGRYLFTLEMTDEDVVRRAQAIFGAGKVRESKTRGIGKLPRWVWRLDNRPDVHRLVTLIYPYLGERRKTRAKEALIWLESVSWTKGRPRNAVKALQTKLAH